MLPIVSIPPKPKCPYGCRARAHARGRFYRLCDNRYIQRYRCLGCRSSFSDASFSQEYRHRIRHLNRLIFKLFSGGYSQRRMALDLGINRKTVVRKFLLLGRLSEVANESDLHCYPQAKTIEFDDLETFIHTKCKPVSITLAVEFKSRRILGFEISQMPAKGKLAKRARKKYGLRSDQRRKGRRELFKRIKTHLHPEALIKSDQNPHYPGDVEHFFPKAHHQAFKGRRGCVVGQGELKGGGFDPLFSLNHTCAMLRANINRLFRRTWCTSKKVERLKLHLALYVLNHNRYLITKGLAR